MGTSSKASEKAIETLLTAVVDWIGVRGWKATLAILASKKLRDFC